MGAQSPLLSLRRGACPFLATGHVHGGVTGGMRGNTHWCLGQCRHGRWTQRREPRCPHRCSCPGLSCQAGPPGSRDPGNVKASGSQRSDTWGKSASLSRRGHAGDTPTPAPSPGRTSRISAVRVSTSLWIAPSDGGGFSVYLGVSANVYTEAGGRF